MRNAWANAVALRSEKSVGCTIERKAPIAIAYRKTALHTTGGRAALHCMGGENMRDVPALGRNFLLLAYGRWATARLAMSAALLAASPAATLAQTSTAFPVGMQQLEYVAEANRHLAVIMFYPAAVREPATARFVMPFFSNLELYNDAEPATGSAKRPLVMFSHGRGSNGLYYAWFAEFLAARGYIVVALNHYRANTYDSTIVYLANKLWQRPRDISLTISYLLNNPSWGRLIDASRIGVAGHSQGGLD